MPYARRNWKIDEVKIALANPVHSASGPKAHSSLHATAGELANHPLFQRARVTAIIHDDRQKASNAVYHTKHNNGQWVYNSHTRKHNPLPKPEVKRHTALNVESLAPALVRALNSPAMQSHLASLDEGQDMKVHVNFDASIGTGKVHDGEVTTSAPMVALFVYCKRNPANKDVPIFQTVVPSDSHKAEGAGVTLISL